MKKIFVFILMAAAMVSTSCLTLTENDAVYEISVGTTSYSVGGLPGGEAYQAADELRAKVRDFSQKYAKQWIVTYNNNSMFNSEESKAVAEYEAALQEFQKIHNAFKAEYAAPATDGTSLECSYKLYLKRNDPDKGDATVRESEEFLFEIK